MAGHVTCGHIALRARLRELGLTQNAAAIRVGLDSGGFSRLVRGRVRSRISVALALRIEAALGVPVALWGSLSPDADTPVSGTDAVCTEAVGTPGVRDPNNRCDMFSPGKPTNGGCQGDGHYLCAECMLLEVPR